MKLELRYRWIHDSDHHKPGLQEDVKTEERDVIFISDISHYSLAEFLSVVDWEIKRTIKGGYTHWIVDTETEKIVWQQNCNGCKLCKK